MVKEATTLGSAGYDVTVLTISNSARFAGMDAELAQGLPFKRIALDHTQGNRTGIFMQRLRTWGARKLCRHLGHESPQSLGPAAALLRAARSCPADLIIAHTEIPLWAAQYLIRDGRRVAVDIEDWYSEDLLPDARQTRPLRLLRFAEGFALNNAAYVSVTSDSMADALVATYGSPRPMVLRNTFPLPTQTRTDNPSPSDHPAIIWFSQTIGPGRGLEEFFDAWTLTKKASRVFLLGDEHPAYVGSLLA
ncbi:MAG: glycosyltransferase, partial [Terriglobales bacterium]